MRNLHYKLLYVALLFVVTGCDKRKDELRSELRLLRAGIETGVNSSEFSQRVIRVRAAHSAAEKPLSQREKTAYARLDSEVTACLFFWKEYTSSTFKRYSYEAEHVVQMFGLHPQRGIKSEEVYYYPQSMLRQMLARSSQSIDAFLDGTASSANSGSSQLRAVEEAVVGEIRTKAVRGDADAQFKLGEIYEQGLGVESDGIEAFKWFIMAARKGHVIAERKLGLMYMAGKVVDQNAYDANYWLKKAAEAGDAEAKLRLSLVRYAEAAKESFEWRQPAQTAEALSLLTSASDLGLAEAQFLLGMNYVNGNGVEADLNKASELLTRAAAQNHTNAVARLAVVKKLVADVNTLQAKAESGDAEAQFLLGSLFRTGELLRKSAESAERWFTKSATQNNPKAQNALGELALARIGDPPMARQSSQPVGYFATYRHLTEREQRDLSEGLAWLRKAAAQGLAEAHVNLGRVFQQQRTPAGYIQAERHFNAAAEKGNTNAVAGLEGIRGQLETIDKAMRGDAAAQFELGRWCEFNDQIEAYKWFRLAAARGHKMADLQLHIVSLSSAEFEEAQRRIQAFTVKR